MSRRQDETRDRDAPGSTPHQTKDRCQYCGTHLSRDYRRTFGDEQNVVHRCYECDSSTRLHKGSGAGKDVDRGDPQERSHQSEAYEPDWRPPAVTSD